MGDPLDLATRSDLECENCGDQFSGTIRQKFCPSCDDLEDQVETTREIEEGAENPAVRELVVPPSVLERNERYAKRVKVDRNRDRVDLTPRKKQAPKPQKTESKKERVRREPLRKKLEALRARKAEFEKELAQVEAEMSDLVMEIEPTEGEFTRECFGKSYDARDYDCKILCPLRKECELKCGKSPETTIVQESGPPRTTEDEGDDE